jgi:hypothetical protein
MRALQASRPPRTRLPLLAAATLVLAGCGGAFGLGPAAPGPVVNPNSFFGGDHHVHWMTVDWAAAQGRTRWGTVLSDGAGQFTGSWTTNTDGVLTGPTPLPLIGYSVQPDLSYSWSVGATEIAHGRLAATHDLAALALDAPGSAPSIAFASRRDGLYSNASLTGTYHFGGFLYSAPGHSTATYWGTITFDGAGTAATLLQVNAGGVVIAGAPPATYTVFADGRLVLTLGGGFPLAGGVIRGGDFAIVSGGTSAGNNPALFVMVRQGAAMTPANLAGTYGVVGLRYDSGLAEIVGTTGLLHANGAGGLTFDVTENVGGLVTPHVMFAAPYAVLANGTLNMLVDGQNLRGGLSASGTVGMVSGGTAAGDDRVFYLLLR